MKIKKIRKLDIQKPQRCITLEDPEGLYLAVDKNDETKNVVTHNSSSAIYCQSFIAGSQKKASELILEPLVNLLNSSPFFERCYSQKQIQDALAAFEQNETVDKIYWTTASPTSSIEMSGGSRYKLISSPGDLLGTNIITATMSEITFLKDEFGWSDEKILKVFTKCRARVSSRMKGNYYGRIVLDSSPNSLDTPIDSWIINQASKNQENFIVRGSVWDLDKKSFPQLYSNGYDKDPVYTNTNSFKIFKGMGGELPHIVTPGMEANYAAQDIVNVPIMTKEGVNLKDEAEESLTDFLRDRCAMPTEVADRVFYDTQKIEKIFEPKLKNLYYGISATVDKNPQGLIWDQVKDIFWNKVGDKYIFWYHPEALRTLSVDQSLTGDVTCISMSHNEYDLTKRDVNGQPTIIYITDFTIPIIPKAGERISLDAIKYFIEDLIVKGKINLVGVSFDQFQSESTLQYLKRLNIPAQKLSVDYPNDPYINYISLYFQERLKCGPNIFYKNNLFSIREVERINKNNKNKSGGIKYDHTQGKLVNDYPPNYNPNDPSSYIKSWNTCTTGSNAKDILDATIASIELLRRLNIRPTIVWEPEAIKEFSYDTVKEETMKSLNSLGLVL